MAGAGGGGRGLGGGDNGWYLTFRELLVIGGDSAKVQLKALQEGVDIVIGTPGRLDDLITTGKLDLSGVSAITPYKGSVITCCSLQQVSFFVLDEAVSPSTHLHTHTHTHMKDISLSGWTSLTRL